jgi:hypothetical protein
MSDAAKVVCTYDDFEAYFESMATEAIGVKSVIIGDMDDAQAFQTNATGDIYPMLFVHVPSFESFNSGGNKNRFETDFLVLIAKTDLNTKKEIRQITREIVLNIQKKMETDAENGLIEFSGRFFSEPKSNMTHGKCYGWMVAFEIGTPGVGLDSDYRD